MVFYVCRCLNIVVSLSDDSISLSSASPGDKSRTLKSPFAEKSKCVQAKSATVQVEHDWLVRRKPDAGWIIHHCLNCGVTTHCESVEKDELILNEDTRSSDEAVRAIKNDVSFSSVFKIVIRDSLQKRREEANFVHNTWASNIMAELDKQATTYLDDEKDARDERIREFTDREQIKFYDLEQRTQREKEKLIEKLSFVQDDFTAGVARDESIRKTRQSSLSDGPVSPVHVPQKLEVGDELDEATLLFPMDSTSADFTDNFQKYDDDSFASEDDDVDEAGGHMSPTADNFSTSVPINVPCSKLTKFNAALAESPQDPNDIGASIKALARSVHGDGSEIFGDLPRAPQPRVDRTADYSLED